MLLLCDHIDILKTKVSKVGDFLHLGGGISKRDWGRQNSKTGWVTKIF